MKQIQIENPIILKMDILETENYLSSVHMQIYIEINNSSGFIKSQINSIWFSESEWDEFKKNMTNSSIMTLKDMSEIFNLTIKREKFDDISFTLSYHKSNPDMSISTINYITTIDNDAFALISNQFNNFEW